MGQVERQAVADVDAGVQFVARVQRQGFADAGLEVEVPAENAAAERAGDEDPVAGPGAAAAERPAAGHFAQQGDADRQRPVPSVGVAAGDGQVILFGQRQHALVQRHGQFHAARPRQCHGDHAGQRLGWPWRPGR